MVGQASGVDCYITLASKPVKNGSLFPLIATHATRLPMGWKLVGIALIVELLPLGIKKAPSLKTFQQDLFV